MKSLDTRPRPYSDAELARLRERFEARTNNVAIGSTARWLATTEYLLRRLDEERGAFEALRKVRS